MCFNSHHRPVRYRHTLHHIQIKDDFLGRAMIHCDLRDTNPDTQAYFVSKHGSTILTDLTIAINVQCTSTLYI